MDFLYNNNNNNNLHDMVPLTFTRCVSVFRGNQYYQTTGLSSVEMRLMSIRWKPGANQKWHSALTLFRCGGQRVISARCRFSTGFQDFNSSKQQFDHWSKRPKRSRRGGAPDRCREQTGRLQLDVDEVARLIFVKFGSSLDFNMGEQIWGSD